MEATDDKSVNQGASTTPSYGADQSSGESKPITQEDFSAGMRTRDVELTELRKLTTTLSSQVKESERQFKQAKRELEFTKLTPDQRTFAEKEAELEEARAELAEAREVLAKVGKQTLVQKAITSSGAPEELFEHAKTVEEVEHLSNVWAKAQGKSPTEEAKPPRFTPTTSTPVGTDKRSPTQMIEMGIAQGELKKGKVIPLLS
jgi:hypothetical protein